MADQINRHYPIFSYPRYVQNWRDSRSRASMTLEERGLFWELIDHVVTTGSIPDDPVLLRRFSGCDREEFERAWPRVKKEFQFFDDQYCEMFNATALRARESVIQRKSASAKGGKNKPTASQLQVDSKLTSSELPKVVKNARARTLTETGTLTGTVTGTQKPLSANGADASDVELEKLNRLYEPSFMEGLYRERSEHGHT